MNREERMSIAAQSAAIAAPAGPADVRRRMFAIVGASSGNLVEWYDFYVYSFTALYFASAFFPTGNRTTELLNAAGVFRGHGAVRRGTRRVALDAGHPQARLPRGHASARDVISGGPL
jgi:hypothetical protein